LAAVPLFIASAAGCGSDGLEGGYYLRGRVFNGASLDPVEKAELTLMSGHETRHVASGDDGTYIVGPIEPSASYRLEAKANGMEPFVFTGLALPALEPNVHDRTLIGDVPLYASSRQSPAFKVVVQSSDPRLPATAAAVDFVPMAVGTDPAHDPTAVMPPNTAVIGAFAEPRAATLPNDAHGASLAFHANATNGSVDVPEGALSWGATYQVRVDAGPDFTAVTFMHTPVKANDIRVTVPTTAKFPTQLPQQAQQYFTGRIYNGVTLDRMTGYSLKLEYFDRSIQAAVDSDGRYIVGPLLANADYTIIVEKDGFRSFLSHNAKIATAGTSQVSSLYYDAFMYPKGVAAPDVHARFALQGETASPSGTVRFAPRGTSSLFDADIETPAGVNRQVWANDEDLQQRAVVKDFTNGTLEMNGTDFVLGVEYAVTVYGVSNYAILNGGTFKAGIDANPTFTLQPISETPLEVVGMSTDVAALSPSGTLEIRFNHDVVAYPKMDMNTALRSINDGFALTSPDKDMDSEVNTLVDAGTLPAPVAPNYRGIKWEISGNLIRFTWDRERALSVADTADPVTSVTYGNLSAITLFTGTLPTSPSARLDNLIGQASVTVQTTAQ
jgi:hypothetical protein